MMRAGQRPAEGERYSDEIVLRDSPATDLASAAVLTLRSEELGPRHYLGVLFEERPSLAFGHAAPYAELDTVVQRVGTAFEHYRAVPADHRSLTLCGSADEELIGICRPA
jgi:hypothetical protein